MQYNIIFRRFGLYKFNYFQGKLFTTVESCIYLLIYLSGFLYKTFYLCIMTCELILEIKKTFINIKIVIFFFFLNIACISFHRYILLYLIYLYVNFLIEYVFFNFGNTNIEYNNLKYR